MLRVACRVLLPVWMRPKGSTTWEDPSGNFLGTVQPTGTCKGSFPGSSTNRIPWSLVSFTHELLVFNLETDKGLFFHIPFCCPPGSMHPSAKTLCAHSYSLRFTKGAQSIFRILCLASQKSHIMDLFFQENFENGGMMFDSPLGLIKKPLNLPNVVGKSGNSIRALIQGQANPSSGRHAMSHCLPTASLVFTERHNGGCGSRITAKRFKTSPRKSKF